MEKAAIQLIDYEKTRLLEPGQSQTLTVTADAMDMARWDSGMNNAVGTKGTYILDEGEYYFTIGNGAHEAVNNVLTAGGKTAAPAPDLQGSDSRG